MSTSNGLFACAPGYVSGKHEKVFGRDSFLPRSRAYGCYAYNVTLLRIRVYLEDTDAGGIVYHAAYLRFMERARTETLRRARVEQSQTFKSDLSFVVHRMELEFPRPAHLDDEIEVSCALQYSKGARVVFTQEVRSVVAQTLHCTALVTVACIALGSKRPRRVPSDILAALAAS